MKNSSSSPSNHLHLKLGDSGSKLYNNTRAGIYLLLLIIVSILAFPTQSHVYALQPAASAKIGSFANEPILKVISIDNYAPYPFVNKEGQSDGFSVDLMRSV
ncbi:MAG: hypothetical protein WCK35_21785, partial [Chloroflexota bacterium]